MKRSAIIYISVILIFGGLTSSARAAIEYGQDDWGIALDANQSITCIAHFVWNSVEFNDVPIQVALGIYPDYENGGRWTDIGWVAELSPDNKITYISGPQVTNDTQTDNLGWFVYTLSYLWDNADSSYDPNYPVYIDTAIYDGGSEPVDVWGWRGIPGIPESWEYRTIPYAVDEPWYTEEFFANPVPEPATVFILGLGCIAFLRKRHINIR